MTNKSVASFRQLEIKLNSEVLERNEEVHTALLALIAKRHHFQVGPPGTAKSLLVSRLASHLADLPEYGYFHYLLTQFTVPGELYGPPNLQDMRDKGIYRLNTAGKLPRAYIAFLDEIFKGNSSILNANLTIMNERKFFNATDDPHIPLVSMFAASNEMPQGDGLNALWDRLHFRHVISPLEETSSFIKMITQPKFTNEPILSLYDIEAANAEASQIPLTDNCLEAIRSLKADMDKQGLKATERRWMDCIPIIRAEAWFNGHEVADLSSMRPLMHVLWEDLENRKLIERLVLDIANPLDKEAGLLYDKLIQVERKLKEDLATKPDSKQVERLSVEASAKAKLANGQYEDLAKRVAESGTPSMVLPKLEATITRLSELVAYNLFGLDPRTGEKTL